MTAKSLQTSGERRKQTINGARTGDYPNVRKIKLNLFYRTPHTKINSRWFKDKSERKMRKKKSGRQYRGTFL